MQLKKILVNSSLVLVSLIFAFGIGELGLRFISDKVDARANLAYSNLDLFNSIYPAEYDDLLGWVPKSNYVSDRKNAWKVKLSTGEYGVRKNANIGIDLQPAKKILAVGDSFTFGDEVSDNESWPAQLESISKIQVINGGVFGYGVDQAFLRANLLLKNLKFTHVVLALHFDDIRRCELSIRTGVPKPYFEINNNEIRLMNVPVPKKAERSFFRKVFSSSFLVNAVMINVNPNYWLTGTMVHDYQVHSNGLMVVCHLLDELQKITSDLGVKLLVVILPSTERSDIEDKIVKPILDCVSRYKIDYLNLIPKFEELAKQQTDYKSYFTQYVHYSPKGNKVIASEINRKILSGAH